LIHYLAYGSNLHPLRLQRRISSATLIGPVELPGYEMSFIKRSKDGSAKCTIPKTSSESLVYAALYSIDRDQLSELDMYEGLGNGYDHEAVSLMVSGTAYVALTYVASETHIDQSLQPYHWYKGLVREGARYHGFPADYIERIQSEDSIEDPDVDRRRENEALLAELRQLS